MALTKSRIFYAYNLARGSKKFDTARLRRALGICLSRDRDIRLSRYATRIDTCMCPDNYRGQVICKHRIALMILFRAEHPLPPDWKEIKRLVNG